MTVRLLSRIWLIGKRGMSPAANPIDEVATLPAQAAQGRLGLGAADGVDDGVGAAAGDVADRRLQVGLSS